VRSYSRVPAGTAVPYRHRDPEWLTPARLAELEAGDRRREALERRRPEPAPPAGQAEARPARIARYAQLRESGLSLAKAAAEMHISRRTARGYEEELT
jgi:hypothetical protein